MHRRVLVLLAVCLLVVSCGGKPTATPPAGARDQAAAATDRPRVTATPEPPTRPHTPDPIATLAPKAPPTAPPTAQATETSTATHTAQPTETPTLTRPPTSSPKPSDTPTPVPPTHSPTPKPPLSIFGAEMYHVNEAGGLAQAVEAGVHWVRVSAFLWDQIQPEYSEPPQYNWSAVDEASLKNISASGMEAIAIVKFAPAWAQKVPSVACSAVKPEALAPFADFLEAAVQRYSAPPYNVRYWELGNEPDVDPSGVPPGDPWGCWGDRQDEYYGGGYYAEMLKVAYPAIKAANPEAQVLVGGLLLDCDPDNPPPERDCSPYRFLEGILRGGGGPYFDILAYHVYSYWGYGLGKFSNGGWPGSVTALPEKTAFVRRLLEEYGVGDKPLMNTEAAMLCREATEDCLQSQAFFVPRVFAEAMALGLKAQSWYALPPTGWWNSGLLHPDLSPKPAYRAYRVASAYLGEARYVGQVSGYPPGVEGYAFSRAEAGERVDVIWSAEWIKREVALPPGASAYDPFGQLIAASGTITLERSPVYVVTTAATATPKAAGAPTAESRATAQQAPLVFPAPRAWEPRSTRSSDEPVRIEFSWDYAITLPPGYALMAVLRASTGELFALPCEAEFTDLWRCTLPPPPPAGPGDYEWWLSVVHEGQATGVESNHLRFPWVEPERSPLPTPG